MSEPAPRRGPGALRLRGASPFTAAGATLIPVSLFLTWFEVTGGAKAGTYTGWFSFHRTDRVLAAFALAALASALLGPSRRTAAVRLVLGGAALAVVVRELVTPPVVDPGVQLGVGAYLGLLAALAVILGGAFALDSVRRGADRWVLRGVPGLSPDAFGLFRIAFGLGLLGVMTLYIDLSSRAAPVEAQRGESVFVQAEWVRWLASSPGALAVLEALIVLALCCFVAGLGSRIAYSVAAVGVGMTALVVIAGEGGAHDWGLPALTVLCLLIVPWGESGLGADALMRRRQGRSLGGAPSRRYGLAVWIPGLTLGVALLAAAYAKLSTSGMEWITEGTVKYHFVEDAARAPVDWALRLTSFEPVAVLMSFAAVAIEAVMILVLVSPRPSVRAAFGLVGASLLGGLYVFQGHFWMTWWVLLLAFLPWEGILSLGRRLRRAAPLRPAPARPAALSGALRVAALSLTAALVVQQLVMSSIAVEEEPFLSNFPMYANMWESEEQFNEDNSKFSQYRFMRVDRGGRRLDADVTQGIEDLGGHDTLVSAFEARAEEEDFEADEAAELSRSLRVLDSRYQQRYGRPLGRVRVVHERLAGYDFDRAVFDRRVVERTTEVVDPATLEVASAEGH